LSYRPPEVQESVKTMCARPASAAEVAAVVSKVGFEMKKSQICQRRSNAIGPTTVCDSEGTDGEYAYLLNVTSPDLNEPQVATLIIRLHQ
jgi:hypothetical protein